MHARVDVRSVLRRYPFISALVVSLCLLVANLIAQQNFDLTHQLASFAPFALAAMASAPSIISGRGGFDISISPVMVFTNIAFVVWLVPADLGGIVAVPILLCMGAVIGALNGFAIARLRLQPVVVTLCSYFIISGVNETTIESPRALTGSHWVTHLSGAVGPVPGALIVIAVPLIVWFALHNLVTFGPTLLAVGGNDTTAFSSGINVGAVRVSAYALGGAIAAIGGLALTGLVASADAGTSTSYTLAAVAAVAIGGTALGGGRGGLLGGLCGAGVIYLLQSLLSTLQVSQTWVQMSYGLVLLVAVIAGSQLSASRGRS
jgi:ribose transport system permease protein